MYRLSTKEYYYRLQQYGGPDGEMGASMRYLSQKFSFKNPRVAGVLNDIGTEEPEHRRWDYNTKYENRFPIKIHF